MKEVRGLGLLIGVICTEPTAQVIADIHKAGVLVVPAGPNVVRLLPNLLVTKEELDEGIAVICRVLAQHGAEIAAAVAE
ncbi:Succinylornithine transaminase/acetylornithine aminotransferase [compost metagenome]